MRRLPVLLGLLAIGCSRPVRVVGPGPTLPASARPNIVVITVDDLGVVTLKAAVDNGWMPNLKTGIMDQGVTFAASYVVDSLCCPSRASFLTGQQSHNHGVPHNQYPGGGVTKLDDVSTLPVWLKAAGYRTGLVGKYLNGYGQDQDPSPRDDATYLPPGWDDWQAVLTAAVFNYDVNDNGTLVTHGAQPADYKTDVLAVRAGDFIREADAGDDAQPFFLWITPTAPHALGGGPLCSMNFETMAPYAPASRHLGIAAGLALPQGPSFNEPNVSDKPAWVRDNYPTLTSAHVNCLKSALKGQVEMMMAVDDLVGTVLAELTAAGELADTLIVFTSDNGFLLGEHRVTKKHNVFEEAIRVPLYVKGPGVVVGTAQQLALNMDLTPTLLELAQATAGLTQDGASLVPILQDVAHSPWRTGFLIEHAQANDTPIPDYKAIRTTQYLWVEYATGERELYDFKVDPFQLASKHANPAYAGVKLTLRQKLQALKACAGSSCWT